MNSSTKSPFTKIAFNFIFVLLFLLITSQIYATGPKQDDAQSLNPIIPNLASITNSQPQFPGMLHRKYPANLPADALLVGSMQPSNRLTAPAATNATSPTPFAPTGHFESTLMPLSSDIAVGLNDLLFAYGASYYGNDTAVSLNKGLTWRVIKETYIRSIATSPVNPNHALTGSDAGILITNDAGISWENSTSTTRGITQIVFSPTYAQDKQIFASTNGNFVVDGKLIRSGDGGFTWTAVPLPTVTNHFALASNFNTSQKIIAAIGGNGVLYSENGGQSWNNRSTGLDLNYGNYIQKVFISPSYATDNTIFALTTYGIYRSKSSGVSWSQFLPYKINDFALHPHYGTNKTLFMIASVSANGETFNVLFRSQDNGQSFEGLVAEVNNFALSPDYANNNTIYASIFSGAIIETTDFNGLVQSTDNGKSWYIQSEMVPNAAAIDIIHAPSLDTNQTIFVIRAGDIDGNYGYSAWKSSDLGFIWERVNLPGGIPRGPIKMALSPNYATDKTVILLVSGNYNGPGTLYKSVDGGINWALLNGNLPIEADRNPNLLLSPNYAQDKTIFTSDYDSGLFRSKNDGQTWQQLSSNFSITHIAVAPEYPTDDRLFISMYNDGISRSDNDGVTWTASVDPDGPNLLIELSPNFLQDDTVFAVVSGSSGGGGWKSTDAGDSWENISGSSLTYYHSAMALSTMYATDQTVAVQSANRAIHFSEDAGNTWFDLEGIYFGYEPAGLALPYWQGRPFPLTANSSGFYIYLWPWQVSAGFNCAQNLSLASTNLQEASIDVALNSASPGQWRVNNADVDAVSWLSITEPDGMLPQFPRLTIDSSFINSPVTAQIGVDIFQSYRHSIGVDVPVFVPCFGTTLPLVSR